MKRREFLSTLSVLGFSIAALPVIYCTEKSSQKPNIIFIMADDHTGQAIGCYDLRLSEYAPTNNIDRIGKEGAILKNCFCTNSICVPSRASILTGQYSHINGVKTLSGKLSPETDNVAKHLQTAGYETAVIGKWHLKEKPAGFDYYNVLRGQGRYHNPILFANEADWENGGKVYAGHSTDVITDISLEWLKNRTKTQDPFFLMCHFKAVHEPFHSHDRYRSLLKDEDIPFPEDLLWPESPKGKRFEGWPLEILKDRFINNSNRYSPPKLTLPSDDPNENRKATYQKFIKDYLRAVKGIDDNVGRLLDYLKETDQTEDTVVIYTSDQGYFLGEHNLFDKRFMLEESLRMPFLIRYPKDIEPETTVDDIVLNIDFAELFLDFAKTKIPETMQGRSFRHNLKRKTPEDWRKEMFYHYWTDQQQRPSHYGIRTNQFKLIYYYGLLNHGLKPEECWELYDLQDDPQEFVNQYDNPEYEEIIVRLKQQLKKLKEEFKDPSFEF